MSMRKRRVSCLLVLVALGVSASPTVSQAQQPIENVAAFARLYGVVRWFYPSDAAAALDWNRFAVEGVRSVREARTPTELQDKLRELFSPLGPGIEIGASLPVAPPMGNRDPALVAWHYLGAGITERVAGGYSAYSAKRFNRAPGQPSDTLETPIAGAASEFPLARGVMARVPLSLSDADARAITPELNTLHAAIERVGETNRRDDIDVRLADVVVAWSAFRHFYPYWDDIAVNWDERLRPHLQTALDAPATRQAHFDAVRLLVADMQDGHGRVAEVTGTRRGWLPVQFRIIDGQVVVIASNDPTVPVGSVIIALNHSPAASRLSREMRLASGTAHYRAVKAASPLRICPLGSTTVDVTIDLPSGGQREVTLPCDPPTSRVAQAKPDSLSEIEAGIWYVDLTRVPADKLKQHLSALAAARGVIFDVRGYPTDAGAAVLPYLMRAPEDSTAKWMHIPRFVRPFGDVAAWKSSTWLVQAELPHIGGRRVFLTDASAVSYAESVMGYVRDHRLGTIVGSPTAGANGNIATFSVPGGFTIVFTGMRVTRHDGVTPLHTIGVEPDILVEPTLAGIRAGRDEVLERALLEMRR